MLDARSGDGSADYQPSMSPYEAYRKAIDSARERRGAMFALTQSRATSSAANNPCT